MSEKAWKRVSSLKLERTLLLLNSIIKRLAWTTLLAMKTTISMMDIKKH